MALYLKYRPQSLDELIGQEQVKKTLLSSFEAGKLSHAYLFVGPRGTGKTSTARILAKMINCEKPSAVSRQSSDSLKAGSEASLKTDSYPCNECSACLSITDGSNLDLIEIDAASNRGIDDIRALREKIKLSPTSAKKKIYIIDEVHMLTTEAFNALLKTLEEPPSHALFILATTDVRKVPQTIMSRVMRLDFKLARTEELVKALERIILEEKIDIEDEALKLIVKKAEGSFRDGVKLLDQIASSDTKITLENTKEGLKIGQFEEAINLVQFISVKNTTEGLKTVLSAIEKGLDVKDLVLSLMGIFRNLVFIKNGLGAEMVSPDYMEEQYKDLINLSAMFTNKDLIQALDVLQSAIEKLKFASIPSLPLELAIVEMCENELSVVSHQSSEKTELINSVILSETKDLKIKSRDSSLIVQNDDVNKLEVSDIPINRSTDILKLKEKWTFVLETVRQYNFSLEALLRQVNIKECAAATVILEVPYSFHQRILESPKNRDLVESLFIDILGRNIRISIILGDRPKRLDDIANVDIAADDDIIRAAAEIFSSDSVN